MRFTRLIFFTLFYIGLVHALQVIMERAKVTELNDKYLDWGRAYVIRYGRKSPYYLNVEGSLKHMWNNNMTMHLLFFEYLHNEYRRSFVEMHLKFCDAVNADPYVGKMLANAGVVCPLPKGPVYVNNMTVEAAKFPNVWPFRKARVDVLLGDTDSAEVMAKIEVFITFLQKKKKN